MEKKYTLEDLAGQRLMLGFDGTTLNPDLKQLIGEYRTGGIILFKANIRSPEQLKTLCSDAQNYARDCGLPKLFIAIDQEGGTVARLRHPFTEFPGNPHIHTLDQARAFALSCSKDLIDMGINMNMAPVMDVAPKGGQSIMKERVFPGDENLVAKLGVQVIQTFQDQNIMAVAKHFPGIGRTIKDSHFFLPVLNADLATLKSSDIHPFEAAFKAGVAGIMLSHISYPLVDKDWQASLSTIIARDLLRKELGYNGLVMTDDLDMKAISHDMPTCIHRIIKAEIDLALICHKGPGILQAVDALKRNMASDSDILESSYAAMERIMAAKKRFLD